MKATEQYFPVMLFIMLNRGSSKFASVDKILKCDHSKGVVSSTFLWCCLLKVVLTLESVGIIPKCDHSNKSYWTTLSCDAVSWQMLYKVVLTLEPVSSWYEILN